jgi:hypothetical protein
MNIKCNGKNKNKILKIFLKKAHISEFVINLFNLNHM